MGGGGRGRGVGGRRGGGGVGSGGGILSGSCQVEVWVLNHVLVCSQSEKLKLTKFGILPKMSQIRPIITAEIFSEISAALKYPKFVPRTFTDLTLSG